MLKRIAILMILASLLTASAGATIQQKTYDEDWATASGMSSCTTTNGCLMCGNDVKTGASVCVNVYANGSCSCKLGTTCTSSGTCTYKP